MKNLIKASKFVIKTLTADPEATLLSPVFQSDPIDNPDLELFISNQIINELLSQNLPFKASIPLDDNKQIKIFVSNAEVLTGPGNLLELGITDATIQFDQTVFKIGIKSNTVALRLIPGVFERDGEFRLVAHGEFSSFDIKHMPSWLEKIFTELVRKKFLSPVADVNITEMLTLDKQIDTGITPLGLAVKPEKISVKISEKGITLQTRFSKLVQ